MNLFDVRKWGAAEIVLLRAADRRAVARDAAAPPADDALPEPREIDQAQH